MAQIISKASIFQLPNYIFIGKSETVQIREVTLFKILPDFDTILNERQLQKPTLLNIRIFILYWNVLTTVAY